MTKRARRNDTPTFTVRVALAAIKGDKTLADLDQRFDIHHNQITRWRVQLQEGADVSYCAPTGEKIIH